MGLFFFALCVAFILNLGAIIALETAAFAFVYVCVC